MATTPNLKLTYVEAAQSQKHVPVNENSIELDSVVQCAVKGIYEETPPGSPTEGDRYITGETPTGAWAGKDYKLAVYIDGVWRFFSPVKGWMVYNLDNDKIYCLDSTGAWEPVSGIPDSGAVIQNASLVGIGTTADGSNPFSARLNAALWTALYAADGGNGDLAYKMNKETVADEVSLLLQTNYSLRAMIGLLGNDDLTFKVSPDGSSFYEALIADKDDGTIKFPAGLREKNTGIIVPQLIPGPVLAIWRSDVARAATPRTYTISSISGSAVNLTTSSVPEIFSSGMRNNAMVRIWNTSKSPAQSAWVNWDNSSTQLNVANAADVATWANGETIRLGDPNPTGTNVLQMIAIDISNYLYNSFGVVFRQKGLLISNSVSAVAGTSNLGLSGSGATGTAFGNSANSDGSIQTAMFSVFTDQLSPISNSNLLFVREQLGTGTQVNLSFSRLVGVYA